MRRRSRRFPGIPPDYMPGSTGRSPERTRFRAGHPTGGEDYSPVLPRLVAVLAARRATTNTSSCVPFAEAPYAADFMLNQQNLSRMHNRLVKQERSVDRVARLHPDPDTHRPKSGVKSIKLNGTLGPRATVLRSRSTGACRRSRVPALTAAQPRSQRPSFAPVLRRSRLRFASRPPSASSH